MPVAAAACARKVFIREGATPSTSQPQKTAAYVFARPTLRAFQQMQAETPRPFGSWKHILSPLLLLLYRGLDSRDYIRHLNHLPLAYLVVRLFRTLESPTQFRERALPPNWNDWPLPGDGSRLELVHGWPCSRRAGRGGKGIQ